MPEHSSNADTFAAAVVLGEAEIVRSAIAHGVDVNALGKQGTPPLVLAAVKGHFEIVDLLIEVGADVNKADRGGGMTALHAAAMNGMAETVLKLIGRGADVDASFGSPPTTALCLAFRRGHLPLVRPLLEAGAAPDVAIEPPGAPADQQGTTPLLYAASVGDVEMIRLLTLHGADANRPKADGFTPLMAAAFRGQLEAVKALAEAGAKVDAVNARDPRKPFSALDLAVLGRHQSIVDYLRERGASPRSGSRR